MDSLFFLIFSGRKPISGVVRRTRLGLKLFVIRDKCKGHLQALSQEDKGSIEFY